MQTEKKIFTFIFVLLFGLYSLFTIITGLPSVLHSFGYLISSSNVSESSNPVSLAAYYTIPGRITLLEAHSHIQVMLGKAESGGFQIVKANDGTFVNGYSENWTTEEMKSYAMKLHKLQQEILNADLDTKIIYIGTQPQIINGYTKAAGSYPLAEEEPVLDTMLYYLRSYQIDYVDMRQILKESELEPLDYVYKTDSRPTTLSAFLCMQAIIGKLNDQYEEQIDPYYLTQNPENYNYTLYNDVFLGNLGVIAGRPFTGTEDYMAITPNFDTGFTYQAQGNTTYFADGYFDETLFREDLIESPAPYYHSSYSAYLGGTLYYRQSIVNNYQPNDIKILFIHDTAALPVAALLASAVGEIHMYAPSLAPDNANYPLLDDIVEGGYDYVIFQSILNKHAFNSLFDFALNE